MRKLALIILVALTFFTLALEAQTTGRLNVRVRDAQGKALEFVNVAVYRGTQRVTGAQTNEKGTAIIINIPPGTYNVRFTLVGYGDVTHQDVRIVLDQATPLSVTLRQAAIEVGPITVVGSADVVDKGKVGSERSINMASIGDVAVEGVAGIISIQPGVTNIGGELHVRGGRANEINFTIDGMSVSDPVDGGSALQVDTDAISDMKVMTGGFSAEFGNAQSGMVNIVTKDGDPDYAGRIEYQTDHIIGDGRNSDVIKFSFGGPVLGYGLSNLRNSFTFFLNGGGEWLDGRLKDYYAGTPNDNYIYNGIQLLEYEYPVYDPYAKRDDFIGIDIGNRNYNAYNLNFKSKYVINESQKVTFAARGDRSYNFPFSYDWRYALQHYAFDTTEQRQYIGTYDFVFNTRMNLKVKASYFEKYSNSGPRGIDRDSYLRQVVASKFANSSVNLDEEYIDGVLAGDYGYASIDNNSDGIYDDGFFDSSFWTYRIQGLEFPKVVPGFVAPGTIYGSFVDDKTTSISSRADFEWQVNDIHLAKTGLELTRHIIEKDQLQSFLTIYQERFQQYLDGIYNMANYDTTGVDPDNPTIPSELYHVYFPDEGTPIPIYYPQDYYAAAKAASGKKDGYKAKPWQAAYYLQDKMEWEGMIVNAGLRFDFWYLGKSYEVAQDDGTYKSFDFAKDKRFQMMVSPRLGVSHPITDRDILRFAYNYQNQLPQMAYIFTSKTPEDANVADQTITVGNPSLEPQITVTYEVGLSHQLTDNYVLDMTAYFKNLYNYVSTQKVKKEGEEQITWYEFISEDYGSARGIDIQLEKLLSNFNTWSIAYSLAWAQGNNSSTIIQDEMTNLREFPLDWDIRHNLNLNYTFRIGRGEEFFVPFTDFILPLSDFTANINWSFASGSPYTPQSLVGNAGLDTNSKRKEPTHQANMRVQKGINFFGKYGMRLFMDVENVFKTKNVLAVYPRTGNPYDDGADLSESGSGLTYPETVYAYSKYIQNPGFVNNFRSVTIGVSFNF